MNIVMKRLSAALLSISLILGIITCAHIFIKIILCRFRRGFRYEFI